MNRLLLFIKEKQSTKRWKLGALPLVCAMIGAASLVSAPPAAAESRSVNVYTTDNDQGGFVAARITYSRNDDGKTYHGNIQGRYQDLEEDGYCVQAFRSGSGGKRRYSLGPTACPKGQSQSFDYRYREATKAVVMVCRVNNKTDKLANCSGWK